MISSSNKLNVTAIQNQNGVFTAFFNDFPGLVVQGKDLETIKDKLASLMNSYLKRLEKMKSNIEIETKSIL